MKNWKSFWQKKYKNQVIQCPQDIAQLAEQMNLPYGLVYDHAETLSIEGSYRYFRGESADEKPVHPGELLALIIEQMNISLSDFARLIGVSKTLLCLILKGQRTITLDLALMCEQLTMVPAHVLLRMQCDYNLFEARQQILKAQKESLENEHIVRMKAIADRFYRMANPEEMKISPRAATTWRGCFYFYGGYVAKLGEELIEKMRYKSKSKELR